jgi:hypothetical protein
MSKHDTLRRDLHPSQRHRTFPSGFYAYDMDFIEFNKHGQPVGCFEYKHSGLHVIDLDDFQIKCHRNTSNLMKVPFFVVQYWYLDATGIVLQAEDRQPIAEAGYYVIPANSYARAHLPLAGQELSERQFVELLARIRGVTEDTSGYSDVKLGYSSIVRNA